MLANRMRPATYSCRKKAIEAAQQWRFRSGMRNGQPVDVAVIIEMTFRLL